jgi:hypothetical protein
MMNRLQNRLQLKDHLRLLLLQYQKHYRPLPLQLQDILLMWALDYQNFFGFEKQLVEHHSC